MGFFDMLIGLFRVPLPKDFSEIGADESRSTAGPITERSSLVLRHRTSTGGFPCRLPLSMRSAAHFSAWMISRRRARPGCRTQTYAIPSDSHNLYEATGIFVSTKGLGAIRNDMNKRG
jgi:hypothetical protein